jgi:DNA-binding transcriptional LysR family regulator
LGPTTQWDRTLIAEAWPGLDVRHLSAFQAVNQTGSFARAGDMLGYTQPAVSQQIAALERIVGARLFDRTSGKSAVSLTPAGEVLLEHIDALGARLAAARKDLEELRSGGTGRLRIGATSSVAARILPNVLATFAKERPGVTVELVDQMPESSRIAALRRGALDLTFTIGYPGGDDLESVILAEDELCLVTSARGAHPDSIACLTELRGVPLLTYRDPSEVEQITESFGRVGVTPNYLIQSDDSFVLRCLAREGLGAAIVSRLSLAAADVHGLAVVGLKHLLPPRPIHLAWSCHQPANPARTSFVAMTRKATRSPSLILAAA